MDKKEVSQKQLDSAKKNIEWMELSKPSVAARDTQDGAPTADEAFPTGKALSPHDRDCGHAHPISGTNSDDLRDWCGEHEL